jgi:TRAP transporter TAXI family solute receptor
MKSAASVPARPVLKRRSGWDLLVTLGPALLLLVAGFALAFQFVEPAPPRHIVMATGSVDGAYYRIALQYQQVLARDGVELELVETAGSAENLALLQQPDGRVELAFLQGSTGFGGEIEGVYSLGSVFYEPLWLFWRGSPPKTEAAIKGRRIAMGEKGSGTLQALEILSTANGLSADDYTAVNLGGSDAAQALIEGSVNAAGFVSLFEAAAIQQLLHTDNISLLPFNRADAYQRQYSFLSKVVLPRGLVSLEEDLPAADIPLVAMVANLAARESLHPALVALLLSAAKEIHGAGDLFSAPKQFPSAEYTVLPLDPDAERYLTKGPPLLQRFLPFWLAILIDRLTVLLIPLVTLLFPLFKIVPPAYRWRVRSRIYRYYDELLDVEAALHSSPSAPELALCKERLEELERKLDAVSVPASYADTLYNLRLHLKLVHDRLVQLDAATTATGA